jgi:hypothetical protein
MVQTAEQWLALVRAGVSSRLPASGMVDRAARTGQLQCCMPISVAVCIIQVPVVMRACVSSSLVARGPAASTSFHSGTPL